MYFSILLSPRKLIPRLYKEIIKFFFFFRNEYVFFFFLFVNVGFEEFLVNFVSFVRNFLAGSVLANFIVNVGHIKVGLSKELRHLVFAGQIQGLVKVLETMVDIIF